MSSFYRSDVSRSIRDSRVETGSSISVLGHHAGAKRVTQQSAAIGNKAYDNTFQINGHVADKVSSCTIKNAFFIGHCDVAKVLASIASGDPFLASVSAQPRLSGAVGQLNRVNIVSADSIVRMLSLTMRKVDRVEVTSLRKAKRKVTVVSKETGSPDAIYAIFPKTVQDSFVSSNVIDRLGLTTRVDTTTVSSLNWASKRHTSTGGFVDLSFPLPGSDESIAQRLLILQDPPFDMLIGNPATHSYFIRKQKPLLR